MTGSAAPAALGADEDERRIVGAHTAADEIAEQRAGRRELPGDRRGREPAGGKPRLPAAQGLAATGFGRQTLLREEAAEIAQIGAQRAHGVRGVAVRDPRRDEALDRGITADVCVVSHKGEAFGNHASAPLNTS